MARVLVVDDDPTVREVVVDYLRAAGHDVAEAADGATALESVRTAGTDLVVLDVMMPGIDGLEVARRLRRHGDVPIVLLTALGSEQDRVVGLEIGADDYVTKPFSPRELVLRVDSILRRTSGTIDTDVPTVIVDGDLAIDRGRRLVTLDGAETALTGREFDLLAFFMSRPGIAFSRDDLLQQVWGWSFGDQSTVTVHVRRLREKIEADPTTPVRLLTVWGVGYRWEPHATSEGDGMSDLTEIWVVAVASGLAVGVLGLLAGWLLRFRSLRWQMAVLAVVTTLTVLVGTQVISRRMLISDHDRSVVLIVTGAAALVSLSVALVLSTALVRWSRSLRDDVRRVGSDSPVVAERRGPAEFQELSSELASAHGRLAEARAREQRLEESRRELVSWVSHDLRTPLAGIRVMAEALEDGMAADPPRYHRQIRGEVDRMVAMVDDLFELSRIHAGQLVVEPQLVALGDLVSEALAAADPVARARSVSLGGEVTHGLQVAADPAGLTRVLANLIVNGIRHTPADGTVHVQARPVEDGVELAVTDGCGGIPDDARERVFEVGFRGTAARTPESDAADVHSARAGLGLAIVKGIVEAHRGHVEVANVALEGAATGCRFVVRLPAGEPTAG